MFALAGNLLLVALLTAHVLFATLAFEMATGRASIPATFAALFTGAVSVLVMALHHRHATPPSQRTASPLLLAAIAMSVAILSPIELLMSDEMVRARDFDEAVRLWTWKAPEIDHRTIPGVHRCAGFEPTDPNVY